MVVANRKIAAGECIGVYGGNVLPYKKDILVTEGDSFYARIGMEIKWRQGKWVHVPVTVDGDNILSRINTNFDYDDTGKPIRQASGGYNVETAGFKIFVNKPTHIEGGPPVRESYDLPAVFATQDIPAGTELRVNYHYSETTIKNKFP